jgi:hypothetical protein
LSFGLSIDDAVLQFVADVTAGRTLLRGNSVEEKDLKFAVEVCEIVINYQSSMGSPPQLAAHRDNLRVRFTAEWPKKFPCYVSKNNCRNYAYADSHDVLLSIAEAFSTVRNVVLPPGQGFPQCATALYSASYVSFIESLEPHDGGLSFCDDAQQRKNPHMQFSRNHFVVMLSFRNYSTEASVLNEELEKLQNKVQERMLLGRRSRMASRFETQNASEIARVRNALSDLDKKAADVLATSAFTLPMTWDAPTDDKRSFQFAGAVLKSPAHFQCVVVVDSGVRGVNVQPGLYLQDGLLNEGRATFLVSQRDLKKARHVHDVVRCWRSVLQSGGKMAKWDTFVPDMVLYRRVGASYQS